MNSPVLTRLRAAVVVATSTLLAGCVSMPVSGPVRQVPERAAETVPPGIYFDPPPPARGATPEQVVADFLEALKATPVRTSVARQYLSAEAQKTWRPEQGIITYADLGEPSGGTDVSLPLVEAASYDAAGAWQGKLAGDDAVLHLRLVQESEEWRIDEVPDALVVPESWFTERYQRANRYFFEPTGQVLVPEPVFVPRGEQFTTQLVRGLLAGPPESLEQVVRTEIPPGLSPGLSVPVNGAGVAEVSLHGSSAMPPDARAEGLVAQFVWTLRQEPRLRAVSLSVDGSHYPPGEAGADLSLGRGERFDPVGARSDDDLFALRDGQLLRGSPGTMEAAEGPFGADSSDLVEVAVAPLGDRVAGVREDRSDVLVAGTSAADEEVTQVASGTGMLTPSWDLQGRLWIIDGPDGQARVRVWHEGRLREIELPGITGKRVRQVLVSRDGTRVVALVRGGERDRVVATRVRQRPSGEVLGGTATRTLGVAESQPKRLRAIGWRTPVQVAVLSRIGGELSQVQTLAVDGSTPTTGLPDTSRFRGQAGTLISSPRESSRLLVTVGQELVDVNDASTAPWDVRGLRSITFVG